MRAWQEQMASHLALQAAAAAPARPAAPGAQQQPSGTALQPGATPAACRPRPRRCAAAAAGSSPGCSSNSQPTPPAAPPAARLRAISNAFIQSQALYTAARLRVADALAEGPLPNGELAQRLAAHPERLYRVMRLLAVLGVFQESGPGVQGGRHLLSAHKWHVCLLLVGGNLD